MTPNARSFYERRIAEGGWASPEGERRAEEPALSGFIQAHGLQGGRVLEVGCGRGTFRHLIDGWTGVDLVAAAGKLVGNRFAAASARRLPFRSGVFDGLWSIAVLEHVPDPEAALAEILRVLKPGGVAFLAPAWHCRPWTAEGLHVRPWSDLTWPQRLRKALIPLREPLWVRGVGVLAIRIARELLLAFGPLRPLAFRYGKLQPNYETFWAADSDACNAMDPHEMLLWFISRGCVSPSHPSLAERLLVRHGAIVIRRPAA